MKLLRNAAMLPAGLWDSEKILHRHRFNGAFGVGGYASGPMMLLAAMHRIPTVVFEPNVEPGFTNRILAGIATPSRTRKQPAGWAPGQSSLAARCARSFSPFRQRSTVRLSLC
jgi:UDP-N-acetylglucosamine:LPS N-acetylglucosamine transferase